jgi:hypothetical protein
MTKVRSKVENPQMQAARTGTAEGIGKIRVICQNLPIEQLFVTQIEPMALQNPMTFSESLRVKQCPSFCSIPALALADH